MLLNSRVWLGSRNCRQTEEVAMSVWGSEMGDRILWISSKGNCDMGCAVRSWIGVKICGLWVARNEIDGGVGTARK